MHNIAITVIGGGAMGSALTAGMISRSFVDAARITVCDPNHDQLAKFAAYQHLKTSTDNAAAVANADWIILAVKPQAVSAVLAPLADSMHAEQLVISIAAGIPLATIIATLQHDKVVRVMPNTPAQVGCGMSAWVATPSVSTGEKELIRAFLKNIGEEVELRTDDEIDKATALHGSGPAYAFYLMEAMIQAGREMGLPDEISRTLAAQTVYGAGALARESTDDPGVLRARVTSKGGGTEAALAVFENEQVKQHMIQGMHAAYERYQELAKLS